MLKLLKITFILMLWINEKIEVIHYVSLLITINERKKDYEQYSIVWQSDGNASYKNK